MTIAAIAAAVVIGLLVNEMSDVSPWVARKIVSWSARLRYADSDRAEIRSEELAALINERPGKLLKLGTATGFAAASISHKIRQRLTGEVNPEPSVSFGGLRRLLPVADEASMLVARYLFPTERYRGEWRRHLFLPVKEVCYGLGAGALVWYLGGVRLQLRDFGLPEYELVFAPSLFEIGLAVLVWSLWRVARWYFNRFTLTNKRLMVVKGVFVRRVAMAPLLRAVDLAYQQTLLGRLLNYGTFTLRSVGRFHPMRRIRYLPTVNELYLRAIEEMYEPEAVEARLGYGEDAVLEVHEQIAFLLAAAMGTDVWPLVRDTVTEVMKQRKLGVANQLDSEADRVTTVDVAQQDVVRQEVAEAWGHRLAHLSDTYLTSELQQAGERLSGCLPETARSWIDASRTVIGNPTSPDGDGEPKVQSTPASVPEQIATA